ncbi:hypothetical protein JW868_02465 [Candidatus Woesearchaeota archaeon]|nr:hypothetical protein [Candidatus Woesearchaeota archaeon]
MKNFIKPIFTRLRSNRTFRMSIYLNNLKNTVTVKKKADQERLYELEKAFNRVNINRRVLFSFRVFFYILLYASLISTFLPVTPLVEDFIKKYFFAVAGFISTTFSALVVYILTRYIDIYMEDLRIITAHQIAIYEDYDNKDNTKFREFLEKMF